MSDKGIMTSGVIGNLRITTDLIKERDRLIDALWRLRNKNTTLRRALEKACEALAGANKHLSADPEWWIKHYMEQAEEK